MKKQIGEIEEEILKDIDFYVDQVNKYKPTGQKISRIKLIRDYFKSLLEGKVLTKEVINIEEPFYFNFNELKAKSEVIATKNKPISELEYQMKLDKIPNNLDTWDIENNTYCYEGNPNKHKGVNLTVFKSAEGELEIKYIVYELEQDKLKLGLIKPELLTYLLEKPEEELLKKLKSIEEELVKDLEKGYSNHDIAYKYNKNNGLVFLTTDITIKDIGKQTGEMLFNLMKEANILSNELKPILAEIEEKNVEKLSEEEIENYSKILNNLYEGYTERTERIIEDSNIVNFYNLVENYFKENNINVSDIPILNDLKELEDTVETELAEGKEDYNAIYTVYNKLFSDYSEQFNDTFLNIFSVMGDSEEVEFVKDATKVIFDSVNNSKDGKEFIENTKVTYDELREKYNF